MSLTVFRPIKCLIIFFGHVVWEQHVYTCVSIFFLYSATGLVIMPKLSQKCSAAVPRRLGPAPVRPAAQSARHRSQDTEEKQRGSFTDRQCPGVFTSSDFAAADFFLPDPEACADKMKVRVDCWFCGVGIDEWEEGDDLVTEHLVGPLSGPGAAARRLPMGVVPAGHAPLPGGTSSPTSPWLVG